MRGKPFQEKMNRGKNSIINNEKKAIPKMAA
jgi:hypothetical protein